MVATHHTLKKRLWLVNVAVLLACPAIAQTAPEQRSFTCATEPLPPTERQTLEKAAVLALKIKRVNQVQNNGITYVPIRPHIIRRTNGTGGYTTVSMNNVMALTNSYYLRAGFQFFFSGVSPDYVDDDALFAVFTSGTSETAVATRNVADAMNQYYVHSFGANSTLGGYAKFPTNDLASTQSFILDEGDDADMGNRLVPHELGHSFNLLHTHEPANGYELVSEANCATAGDLVCDTPADPYGRFAGASSTCVSGCPPAYICGFTEPGTGALYNPSPTNIMSYYFPCQHDLTNGQYDRLSAGLALRQTHTAYSLTAVSTAVNPATALTATLVNGRPVLTWTDNASNEMGYFIERSLTSANGGFVPIGGVAANATTFTDLKAPALTTVYYRVRPSNSTGDLSNTATIDLPVCQPFYQNGCSQFQNGIGSVTFNAQVLSQNSGCSVGSYGQFTAVTPSVTPGNSYTFTVKLINTANAMRFTIWADFNQNGSFADPGELLYQTPAANRNGASGTITVPMGASLGIVPLRIIALSSSATNPSDPCGNYNWGEAEDYRLRVVPICTVMTTVKNGNWTDPTTWSCNRVPVVGEAVTVEHRVTIPAAIAPNPTGSAGRITCTASGQLLYQIAGRLNVN